MNDKQQQGFQTTSQAAQAKMLRKFYAQKVTRRELAEFEQGMRNAFGTILAVSNWTIDNAGLREKYEADVAAEKAAQETAVGQATAPAPVGGDGSVAPVPDPADNVVPEVSPVEAA